MPRNNYLQLSVFMLYLHTFCEKNTWGNTLVSGFKIFHINYKYLVTSTKKPGILPTPETTVLET